MKRAALVHEHNGKPRPTKTPSQLSAWMRDAGVERGSPAPVVIAGWSAGHRKRLALLCEREATLRHQIRALPCELEQLELVAP